MNDSHLVNILEDISLKIHKGEWVALLGANGSGKTTLLKILSALLLPTQGVYLYFGAPLWHTYDNGHSGHESLEWHRFSQECAIVFQNPEDQIVAVTVEEEAAFGAENICCKTDEIIKRINSALAKTGLIDKKKSLTSELSGGEKQRLALASALVLKPKAILLDEAMSMLDPKSRAKLLEIINEAYKSGVTIIQITHNLEEIRSADRVFILPKNADTQDGREKLPLLELTVKQLMAMKSEELLKYSLKKPEAELFIEKFEELVPQWALEEGADSELLARVMAREDEIRQIVKEHLCQ